MMIFWTHFLPKSRIMKCARYETSFCAFLYTMITDQWEAWANQRPSWGHRTHLWLVGDEKAHVSKFNFSRGRPDDLPSHFDAAIKIYQHCQYIYLLLLSSFSLSVWFILFLAQPLIHFLYIWRVKIVWEHIDIITMCQWHNSELLFLF